MSDPGINPDDDLSLGQTLRGFAAGQKVFRRYTLRKMLGRGGMGVVWLAQDEKLEQEVALKFLPEAVRLDPGSVEELKRETRRSLKLTHPNIVRTYDFVDDTVTAAIAMEYVDGSTLAALRVTRPDKVLGVAELLPLARQLGAALDYAHQEARIVHRDLKPANLMVTVEGRLKITDFGIARSLNDSLSRITMTGGTSGTMVYMSPQQLDGHAGQAADDVYALGATLYEMLAGRPPFYSGDIPHQIRALMPPTIAARRRELEIEAASVPEEWEQTIMACLAKDPAQRPRSAGEVVARLQAPVKPVAAEPAPPVVAAPPVMAAPPVLDKGPAPVPPPVVQPPVEPKPEPPRRKPAKAFALVAVVLAVVIAGWYYAAKVAADKRQAADLLRQAEDQRQAAQQAAQQAAVPPAIPEVKPSGEDPKPRVLSVPQDYSTIQAALDAAKPGDTVKVAAGVYAESVTMREGVHLAGEGRDVVEVQSTSHSAALVAVGITSGWVTGMCFEQTDTSGDPSNRVAVMRLIDGSALEINDCRIRHGDGHGIVVIDSSPKISGCFVENNGWGGIIVLNQQSHPSISHNRCVGNGNFGIDFWQGASGDAEANDCLNNQDCGIMVDGSGSSVTLKANQCRDNRMHGIEFRNSASGSAEQNVCDGNKDSGITVFDEGTTVTISGNTCDNNSKWGIWCEASSKATVSDNESDGNGLGGLVTDGKTGN